jgi:hypothetical protein|tara:strand:- start:281 stop:481 length:201 start_codon:yes stop_codon:yes gene_type:complete
MEALQEYIKKFYVEIPNYVEKSNKSIQTAMDKGDINLVKSLIAYRNYLNRLDTEMDDLDVLLKGDY